MAGLALSCLKFCQALEALPEAVQARLIKCCVPNRAHHRTIQFNLLAIVNLLLRSVSFCMRDTRLIGACARVCYSTAFRNLRKNSAALNCIIKPPGCGGCTCTTHPAAASTLSYNSRSLCHRFAEHFPITSGKCCVAPALCGCVNACTTLSSNVNTSHYAIL